MTQEQRNEYMKWVEWKNSPTQEEIKEREEYNNKNAIFKTKFNEWIKQIEEYKGRKRKIGDCVFCPMPPLLPHFKKIQPTIEGCYEYFRKKEEKGEKQF